MTLFINKIQIQGCRRRRLEYSVLSTRLGGGIALGSVAARHRGPAGTLLLASAGRPREPALAYPEQPRRRCPANPFQGGRGRPCRETDGRDSRGDRPGGRPFFGIVRRRLLPSGGAGGRAHVVFAVLRHQRHHLLFDQDFRSGRGRQDRRFRGDGLDGGDQPDRHAGRDCPVSTSLAAARCCCWARRCRRSPWE